MQEKRAEKSTGGVGHHASIRMSGGRIRLRTWQYGISSLIGWKNDTSSFADSLAGNAVGVTSSTRLVTGPVGGIAFSRSSESEESFISIAASSTEAGF